MEVPPNLSESEGMKRGVGATVWAQSSVSPGQAGKRSCEQGLSPLPPWARPLSPSVKQVPPRRTSLFLSCAASVSSY